MRIWWNWVFVMARVELCGSKWVEAARNGELESDGGRQPKRVHCSIMAGYGIWAFLSVLSRSIFRWEMTLIVCKIFIVMSLLSHALCSSPCLSNSCTIGPWHGQCLLRPRSSYCVTHAGDCWLAQQIRWKNDRTIRLCV